MPMTVIEAARHFQVNRKTILEICNHPVLSEKWGCVIVSGKWEIRNPPAGTKWYPITRVSQIMNRSRIQIFRLCKRGAIDAVKVGRNYRVSKEEVVKLFWIRD